MDVACLLTHILKENFGIQAMVANFYIDARRLIGTVQPRVVVTPFFYQTSDPILRDYVDAWPAASFFNMAWEQILYGAHQITKAPKDGFSRTRVRHLAWSAWYADFLTSNGVPVKAVLRAGHPVYQLYRPPYAAYFTDRETLARRHRLHPGRRWVFIPENYRWAFLKAYSVRTLAQKGLDPAKTELMRRFCRDSFAALVRWCRTLAETADVEIILRPRPAHHRALIRRFIAEEIGRRPRRFHIIKEESAREWVLASDVVVSSFSTTLIEAALAGKPVLIAEPVPMIPDLQYDWCRLVATATTEAAFVAAVTACGSSAGEPLRSWAEAEFLAGGDPFSALADALAALVRGAGPQTEVPRLRERLADRLLMAATAAMPRPLRYRIRRRFLASYFFNHETHEKDIFTNAEVARRVAAWARVLDRKADQAPPRQSL